MVSAKDPQVLIVGAGPTGLVLALVLLRNGVRVRLIEKDLAARIGQRGAGIMPRSLEIFHLLGVSREIESKGIYSPRVRLYDMPDGITPIQTFDMQPWNEPTPACPYLNIQHLGQDNLEIILRNALAQLHCHVEQSAELQSFEQHDHHVTAHIRTRAPDGSLRSETSDFDYIVGSDGARGVVRKLLGLSFLGETRVVEHLVVGDVTVDNLDEEFWHMWGDASTTLVSLRPTETPKCFNFMIAGCDVDHASLANDEEAVIKFIYSHTGKMRENGMIVEDVTWLSHYKPNIRMVDTFGIDRVLVAGDAAHVHSPTGGQGMNTGIQDAFNLGWKLSLVVRGLADATLLDSYTEERLPVIADMLDQTTVILKKAFNGRARTEEEKHWVEVHEVEREREREPEEGRDSREYSIRETDEELHVLSDVDEDEEDGLDSGEDEDEHGRAELRQQREEEGRPGSLLQLGVNYRNSPIIVDEQMQLRSERGGGEKKKRQKKQTRYADEGVDEEGSRPSVSRHDSYGRGDDDGYLKAGDRAPDAPALRGVRYSNLRGQSQIPTLPPSSSPPPLFTTSNSTSTSASASFTNILDTRLFDVFSPSQHTLLVFTPESPQSQSSYSYTPIVDALEGYPEGCIQTVVLSQPAPMATPTATTPSPNPTTAVPSSLSPSHHTEGIDWYLEDTEGYAKHAYTIHPRCHIVVVRPDGFVGAVVGSAEGVKRYFDGIFLPEIIKS